ncbi:MAG: hypothetical protein Q9165_005135 [Trypethelium subeluteriae]
MSSTDDQDATQSADAARFAREHSNDSNIHAMNDPAQTPASSTSASIEDADDSMIHVADATAQTPASNTPIGDADSSSSLSSVATIAESSDLEALRRDETLGDMAQPASTVTMESELAENEYELRRTYHTYRQGSQFLHGATLRGLGLTIFYPTGSMLPNDPVSEEQARLSTGIWAIEFAKLHPAAKVVGSDLNPVTPVSVPPNFISKINNGEDDDWSYSTPFDYIHGRLIITCFSDPRETIFKAFDNLNPGGYFEIHELSPLEFEDDVPQSKPIRRWMDLCVQASLQYGRPWNSSVYYARWMRETGFENVEERLFKLPSNPYEGLSAHEQELGRSNMENLNTAVEALSLQNFTRVLGWTPADVLALATEVRKDLRDGVKAYSTA